MGTEEAGSAGNSSEGEEAGTPQALSRTQVTSETKKNHSTRFVTATAVCILSTSALQHVGEKQLRISVKGQVFSLD